MNAISDHVKQWVDPCKVKSPLQDRYIKYIDRKPEDGMNIICIACNKFDGKGRGKTMYKSYRLFGSYYFREHAKNKYHIDSVQRNSAADKK